jgi:hypothetical protein
MDFDLIFVIGVALAAFAIPSFVSAYADRRWPKQAVLMLLIGAGAIAYAMQENPDTYSVTTIDDTILVVLGRYLN